ncbi:MAG: hypothetical protein V4556_10075 [Bacteroidota bacterium]
MKFILFFTSIFFIISCSQTGVKNAVKKDSIIVSKTAVDTANLIIDLTGEVLGTLKKGDYTAFANYMHPQEGVQFSPYGNIDTLNHLKLSSSEFLKKINVNEKLIWGAYDGTGDTILLSIKEYLKKFVYNADFLNADSLNFNRSISHGNSLNNLADVYKNCLFTESYFAGFDKKYEGMDWCSLKLVYKQYNGKFYLIAVIHDQWTT